ncbi:unnamed protein product [Rangifer tarandus platyrhynchus]|uniref:Uncharacterized protein n=1 Tax=Rangifer tarandus platyrhynchus TaxID=3082113 RepID=A0ABN8XJT1_RANTA|nr:unnamed protein product [Rangifer tarandus platyrhynchus]
MRFRCISPWRVQQSAKCCEVLLVLVQSINFVVTREDVLLRMLRLTLPLHWTLLLHPSVPPFRLKPLGALQALDTLTLYLLRLALSPCGYRFSSCWRCATCSRCKSSWPNQHTCTPHRRPHISSCYRYRSSCWCFCRLSRERYDSCPCCRECCPAAFSYSGGRSGCCTSA